MTTPPPRRCVWLLLAGLAGCDSAPPAVPTPATQAESPASPLTQPGRPSADKPDLQRMDYDPSARTLTLYDLPGRGGRWVLVTPGQPAGTPISGAYTFPPADDCDPDKVCVYYTQPDRRPSPRVTLREITDAHTLHATR